jgi:esterase/lipase superfamily enzyme
MLVAVTFINHCGGTLQLRVLPPSRLSCHPGIGETTMGTGNVSSSKSALLAAATAAFALTAGCAGVTSPPPGDPSPVRGNFDGFRQAGSVSRNGHALVCTVSAGSCFLPTSRPAGSVCECATSTGIVTGSALAGASSSSDVELASVVSVFFATDRKPGPAAGGGEDPFGRERAEAMSYGIVKVSIPATHHAGQLEAPLSFVRVKFLENAKKHVLLLSSDRLDPPAFFSRMKAAVSSAERPDALIFVHGFNNTFSDAARRTAQIAFDVGFQGVPVLFSWASRGSPTPLGYSADSQTIQWSRGNLERFLEDVLVSTDAQRIYLIGHSMGTQALTTACVALFQRRPELRHRIKEVILAAPDIDAGIFRRDIAPAMVRIGAPVTIYASSQDRTMSLSKLAAAYARVGDVTDGLVLVPGIETIDATPIDTGFLGHSTFAEARELLTDWNYIVSQSLRAKDRAGLRQVRGREIPYWVFRR